MYLYKQQLLDFLKIFCYNIYTKNKNKTEAAQFTWVMKITKFYNRYCHLLKFAAEVVRDPANPKK